MDIITHHEAGFQNSERIENKQKYICLLHIIVYTIHLPSAEASLAVRYGKGVSIQIPLEEAVHVPLHTMRNHERGSSWFAERFFDQEDDQHIPRHSERETQCVSERVHLW